MSEIGAERRSRVTYVTVRWTPPPVGEAKEPTENREDVGLMPFMMPMAAIEAGGEEEPQRQPETLTMTDEAGQKRVINLGTRQLLDEEEEHVAEAAA